MLSGTTCAGDPTELHRVRFGWPRPVRQRRRTEVRQAIRACIPRLMMDRNKSPLGSWSRIACRYARTLRVTSRSTPFLHETKGWSPRMHPLPRYMHRGSADKGMNARSSRTIPPPPLHAVGGGGGAGTLLSSGLDPQAVSCGGVISCLPASEWVPVNAALQIDRKSVV